MFLLGFDIGGTKCAVVLGKNDFENPIVDKISFPTDVKRGWRLVLAELFDTADKLLEKHKISTENISGIGISCGGPLDSKKGIIQSPPNLPDWDNVPIVKLCKERFGVPTVLQNDANTCAVAEWKYGAAKGTKNAIFLTFGTGMGAGLILDGKLYSGTNDLAGEVGHIRLTDDGPEGYGKKGSFEGYCSGGGIANLAKLMAKNTGFQSDLLEKIETVNAKDLSIAMQNGDEFARSVYEKSAEKLAAGLSILIDILDPEMIVIGSIYARNTAFFNSIIIPIIEKEALSKSCKIVPAKLGENIGDYAALSLALSNEIQVM
ncbi:MAG TPA: ROK family protein [Clostridiales bacterium]|nr:ROK family protein [Clostridiales bacterium]